MIYNEKCYKNPYNRTIIPLDVRIDIADILLLGRVLKNSPNIILENDFDSLSKKKKIELRTINIFQKQFSALFPVRVCKIISIIE